MRVINLSQDVVLGAPLQLDAQAVVTEKLTIQKMVCSFSGLVGAAYVGLLWRPMGTMADSKDERDLTGGVLDCVNLAALEGQTIEPGILRVSGIYTDKLPAHTYAGVNARFNLVIGCTATEPKSEEWTAYMLWMAPYDGGGYDGAEAARNTKSGGVIEVVREPFARFQPSIFVGRDLGEWSLESCRVGPKMLVTGAPISLVDSNGLPSVGAMLLSGEDVWPGVQIAVTLRNNAKVARRLELALYGRQVKP
jgi:hypothetical protein